MEQLVETKRLELRVMTPALFANLFESTDDSGIMKALGLATQADLEKQRQIYEQGIEGYNRSFWYYLICHKEHQKVLGWCGYHTWATRHDRAELGYILYSPEYHGQGIMGEVLPKVIEAGFQQLGLNRIEALVGRHNPASQRLLEKNAFSYEGCLRGHYLIGGKYEDSLMYGLLKSEWKKV